MGWEDQGGGEEGWGGRIRGEGEEGCGGEWNQYRYTIKQG